MKAITFKDFFEINSSFGYAFGNKVLREIAEQWRTVSEEGMIYRTEGNKIVLLFRADSYDIDEIKEKFRSIANYFKEKMTINGIRSLLILRAVFSFRIIPTLI